MAIWEFIMEEICSAKNEDKKIVYTDWVTLTNLRRMLVISDDQYTEFKAFNHGVLKAAVKEINDVSDLSIKVEFKKVGRFVSDVRFVVKRTNINTGVAGLKANSVVDPSQKGEAISEEISDMIALLMNEYCIAKNRASELLENFDIGQIRENLKYVKKYKADGGAIKNIAAFTIKAIENDYRERMPESSKMIVDKWDKQKKLDDLRTKIRKVEDHFKSIVMDAAKVLVKDEVPDLSSKPDSEQNTFFLAKYDYLLSQDDIDTQFIDMLKKYNLYTDFFDAKDKVKQLESDLANIDERLRKK